MIHQNIRKTLQTKQFLFFPKIKLIIPEHVNCHRCVFNSDTRPSWFVACRYSSTKDTNTNQNQNEEHYEEDIKDKILEASLPFVVELGWSKNAISAGAKAVGYPGVTHGLFSRGGGDLVYYFQRTSNQKLVEYLKQVYFLLFIVNPDSILILNQLDTTTEC